MFIPATISSTQWFNLNRSGAKLGQEMATDMLPPAGISKRLMISASSQTQDIYLANRHSEPQKPLRQRQDKVSLREPETTFIFQREQK